MLPRGRAFGDDYFLETMLLVAAAKIVNAKRVFEFGTYHGTSTLNLALNLLADGEVFTLDLPNTKAIKHRADMQYALEHLSLGDQMDYTGSAVEHKIKRLIGNSRKVDFSPYVGSMDLVFVDAGHDEETAHSDTGAAFLMCRAEQSCILWHDYGHPDYPELTQYLNWLAERRRGIVHIIGTMYCCWFSSMQIFP